MEYAILDRKIEINDEIIEAFLLIDDASNISETSIESILTIRLLSKYKHSPTQEDISDEALIALCNEILIAELDFYKDFPKVIETIEYNYEKFKTASKVNELIDIKLE